MSEQTNGSAAIQAGTAEGLMEFLDYVVAKGYGPATAAGPQKSAVRQVLQTTEGDGFESFDIKNADLEDLLNRFAIRARGELKAESIQSYRNRMTRAVETYREFLATGQPPRYRQHSRQRKDVTVRAPAARATASAPAPTTHTSAPADRLLDYPFPLRGGAVANLRLPARLEKEDAERMAAFIRALVFDAPKQLPPGEPEPGRD